MKQMVAISLGGGGLFLNVSILFSAVLNISLFLYLAGHVSKAICYDPLFCGNSFV